MKSSFFIVADRGNLKAYRVEKTATDRNPRVQLVQAFSFVQPHLKLIETNSDAAGRFPVGAGPASGSGGGNGRHQNSVSEKHYDIEFDRRSVKELAQRIDEVLRAENPGAWSFAAPAELKEAVLDQLAPEQRKLLAESLSRNLVNVDKSELLEHFSEVRAA
jgi:hypothetical protein